MPRYEVAVTETVRRLVWVDAPTARAARAAAKEPSNWWDATEVGAGGRVSIQSCRLDLATPTPGRKQRSVVAPDIDRTSRG